MRNLRYVTSHSLAKELLDKEDFQSMSLIDKQKYLADIISLFPTEEQRYFVDVIMDIISNEEP